MKRNIANNGILRCVLVWWYEASAIHIAMFGVQSRSDHLCGLDVREQRETWQCSRRWEFVHALSGSDRSKVRMYFCDEVEMKENERDKERAVDNDETGIRITSRAQAWPLQVQPQNASIVIAV